MPELARSTLPQRLANLCFTQRWLVALFVAALVVRLHWNLEIHPLGDYIYSDMGEYARRANQLLADPSKPHEYHVFFPWGTHTLIAGIKALFGRDNYTAVGIVYAVLGAFGVAFAYAIARRATSFPFVAPAVGLAAVFYYPHISLGGYLLSETPFSFFLLGAVLFSLRLADHGRARDAWIMGLFAGIGTWVRPQIGLSAALLGLFWLAHRKHLPKIRLSHLLQSAVPVIIALAISAGVFHFHTGRVGLVSENGAFNMVFGRCHNTRLKSLPDGKGHGHVHFSPPEFIQLNNLERRMAKQGRESPHPVDAVFGDTISYRGYVGDREILKDYIRKCIAETGWRKQLRFAWTHVVLLWRYNVPWPDSGRSTWRGPARWWTALHRDVLAIPAILSLLAILIPSRRTAKLGLVAIHLLALMLLAALVFGGTRHRAPYDLLIIFLAFEVYAFGLWLLVQGVKRWQRRRHGPPTRAGLATAEQPSASDR